MWVVALIILYTSSRCRAVRPVITEHPRDVRVHRGAPATLNCGAYGVPAPTVSWYKDGERVLTGAGDHTVLLPGGSLFFLRTLHNHRARDSGVYTCRAENQEGVVHSNSATLTVTYLKHEFGHVPKLVTAEVGENIALSCFPPEGNPKPKISWLREGEILSYNSGKYSLDPSGILLVNCLDRSDAGKYECIVSNEAGTRNDSPVTLKITEQTYIKDEAEEVVEEEEETMEEEEEEQEDLVEFLSSPVITESVLLDRVTGLVHWLPVTGCSGYIVRVQVAGEEVTNITVEQDINQVKLHSLDPDLRYSVSVAAIRNSDTSPFSKVVELTGNLKEITVHMTESSGEEEIPTNVWVVGMIVVVLITLIIIVSAVVVFHKIAGYKERTLERCETPEKLKRYSWIDKRWTENQTSSFKSDRLLLHNHYDYVIHNEKVETSYSRPVHAALPVYIRQSGGSPSEIYHYASSPVVQQDYLMPIKPQNI